LTTINNIKTLQLGIYSILEAKKRALEAIVGISLYFKWNLICFTGPGDI
jgi:hypothetical protein